MTVINSNKKVIFRTYAPFSITKINNTQVYDAKDVIMSMHNLIEYSDFSLKKLGSLWQ